MNLISYLSYKNQLIKISVMKAELKRKMKCLKFMMKKLQSLILGIAKIHIYFRNLCLQKINKISLQQSKHQKIKWKKKDQLLSPIAR